MVSCRCRTASWFPSSQWFLFSPFFLSLFNQGQILPASPERVVSGLTLTPPLVQLKPNAPSPIRQPIREDKKQYWSQHWSEGCVQFLANSWTLQCWLHLPQPGGTAHFPPTLLLLYPIHIPPLWWWRHNGRLCQKLRGATPYPSPSPDCWSPHHRKQIYTSLGMVWLVPEFSQLCTALPPPSRMWFHLLASPGADMPPTSPHAAVKAIEPGTEQLTPKHSLQLSKPLLFWEKYRWWHSRWNNYVVESCNIYVKGYYTRAPNVSKITSKKQHAGFACLSPTLIMLTHVYVRLLWVFITNILLINSPFEFYGISFWHKINWEFPITFTERRCCLHVAV